MLGRSGSQNNFSTSLWFLLSQDFCVRTQSHEIGKEEEEEGEVSEGEETVGVDGGEGIRETVEMGKIPGCLDSRVSLEC